MNPLTDFYGTPLAIGDIVEETDTGHVPCWKYHSVEDTGWGPEIRDFAGHNVGMCYKPGVCSSAEELEEDVWELMRP